MVYERDSGIWIAVDGIKGSPIREATKEVEDYAERILKPPFINKSDTDWYHEKETEIPGLLLYDISEPMKTMLEWGHVIITRTSPLRRVANFLIENPNYNIWTLQIMRNENLGRPDITFFLEIDIEELKMRLSKEKGIETTYFELLRKHAKYNELLQNRREGDDPIMGPYQFLDVYHPHKKEHDLEEAFKRFERCR